MGGAWDGRMGRGRWGLLGREDGQRDASSWDRMMGRGRWGRLRWEIILHDDKFKAARHSFCDCYVEQAVWNKQSRLVVRVGMSLQQF